jgi:Ser/Thr protein kinase RdoA (MazF antagonist)
MLTSVLMTRLPDNAESVAAVLAERYGLAPDELARLPAGQATANYRAVSAHKQIFVKCYPQGTDLTADRSAIGLAEIAGRQGIPVPSVVRSLRGQVIDGGISVWDWVPGQLVTSGLTRPQYKRLGFVLGQIHHVFNRLPGSRGPAPRVTSWKETAHLAERIIWLRKCAERRLASGHGDKFDARAVVELTEREAMVRRIPGLLDGLSALGTQLLHGDYSLVNVLFDGDRLSAVLDFGPPEPFLVAYELGRIAFSPGPIATDPGWLDGARELISAYLEANPLARRKDVRACGRVALFQLVRSLYGIKEHYLKSGMFQDQLDQFWHQRHQAAAVLLDRIGEIDDLLADLTKPQRA